MTTPLTPQQIRGVELPRGRRGFDEEATRKFLAEAAGALTAMIRERDALQKQVQELGENVSPAQTDAEALGTVLLTANRVAEEVVAEATQEAAAIKADAVRQRDDLLDQAQGRADAMVTDAAANMTSLRQQDDALRQSIALHRQELVIFLRSALAQLESVEALTPATAASAGLDGDLISRLPSE